VVKSACDRSMDAETKAIRTEAAGGIARNYFVLLFSTSTFPRALFDTLRPACSKDIVCPLVAQRGEGRVRTIRKFYQITPIV
jgi:hypothetical protein